MLIELCLFHIANNVWSHVQKHAPAREAYTAEGTNSGFACATRALVALAFLPPGEVQTVFNLCRHKWEQFGEAMAPIHKYFEVLLI